VPLCFAFGYGGYLSSICQPGERYLGILGLTSPNLGQRFPGNCGIHAYYRAQFYSAFLYVAFRNSALKLFLLLSFADILILKTIYKETLLSCLVVINFPEPIDTLPELVNYPGPIKSYDNWLAPKFAFVEGPVYDELRPRLTTSGYSFDEVKGVSEGKWVLVDTRISLDYTIRLKQTDR
jgi:hypothetical protein